MKKVINLILICVISICFYKIALKYYQYYKDTEKYSQIQTFKPELNNDGDLEDNEYKLKEQKLLGINDEYKMWINIDNTNIDYPVVQGKDNDFYLNHGFDKEESISGTLFIDYKNNIERDKNIVIYGHHMKNKTMFHNLNYFKEEDFFNESEITVIRDGNLCKYEPFSVYVIPEEEAIFNMSFSDDNKYEEYLKSLSDNSYFYKDIDLDKGSEIITLITCSYEYDDARTVVHGVRYN